MASTCFKTGPRDGWADANREFPSAGALRLQPAIGFLQWKKGGFREFARPVSGPPARSVWAPAGSVTLSSKWPFSDSRILNVLREVVVSRLILAKTTRKLPLVEGKQKGCASNAGPSFSLSGFAGSGYYHLNERLD